MAAITAVGKPKAARGAEVVGERPNQLWIQGALRNSNHFQPSGGANGTHKLLANNLHLPASLYMGNMPRYAPISLLCVP